MRVMAAILHFLGHLVAVGRTQRDGRRELARQRALDRERHAHRLAGDAEGRHVQAQELDVGQPRPAAHRHGKDRHAPHPQRARRPAPAAGPRSSRRRRPARRRAGSGFSAGARTSGSFRSVPWPGFGSANGWITTFIRSRSLFQVESSVSGRDRLAPRDRRAPARPLRPRARIARVHAGRRVPEHGDRRLFLGAELLDPFRLVEQDRHACRPAPSRSSSSNPIDVR